MEGDSKGGESRGTRVPGAAVRWLGLGLLFVLATVALTWPLAPRMTGAIPLGTETVATVPLFNLWTLEWNVESVGRGYEGYWRAPIFHPAPAAFALSEPQPLSGLLAAAITGLGGSPLLAYNLVLLLALASNGLLAVAVLRAAGLGWLAAAGGGFLVLMLPFTHQELGVLHLVPLAGVFLFAFAALRFAAEPGLGRGLLLGLGLAVAYLLSAQVAVLAVLAGGPALLWLWWPLRRRRRAWVGLAAAGALFLALVSPVALAQLGATSGEGFERSVDSVRKQSALPAQYLESPWPQLFPLPGVETAERPSQRAFWPGTLRVFLALGALLAVWRKPVWRGSAGRHPPWRRLALAAGLVAGTAFLLSLGARLGVGELSLLSLLRAVPGLSQIRSFFRFALFVQLAVAALAALGLELLLRESRRRLGGRKAVAVVAAVALLAVIEIRPAMGEIQPLPPLDLELPWLEWVEGSTEPGDVLAFVPFPAGRSSRAYLGTSQWMYWQMRHGRPMVNGYSGFFPQHFRRLKEVMGSFPSPRSLAALHGAGVRYVIVHRAFLDRAPAPDPAGPYRLEPVFHDPRHALDVFELRRSGN